MDQMSKPIKVAVAADGSHAARSAMELLTRVGNREQLEITVLTVLAAGSQRLESIGEILGSISDREGRSGPLMRDAVLALGRAGFAAKGHLMEGRADHELIRAIKEHGYELVVMGSGWGSVLGHLVLGSVSTYVLDHSPSSVLVVHSLREPRHPARILLAVDGTPGSEEAVGFIRKVMDPARCHVKVASIVASDPLAVVTAPGLYVPFINEHERHRLRVKAERIVDEATARITAWGFPTSSVVADGPVERTLETIGSEWQADLTVIGSRRLGRGRRLLLGSIGTTLARRTPATLVVRDAGSATIELDDVRTRSTHHTVGV